MSFQFLSLSQLRERFNQLKQDEYRLYQVETLTELAQKTSERAAQIRRMDAIFSELEAAEITIDENISEEEKKKKIDQQKGIAFTHALLELRKEIAGSHFRPEWMITSAIFNGIHDVVGVTKLNKADEAEKALKEERANSKQLDALINHVSRLKTSDFKQKSKFGKQLTEVTKEGQQTLKLQNTYGELQQKLKEPTHGIKETMAMEVLHKHLVSEEHKKLRESIVTPDIKLKHTKPRRLKFGTTDVEETALQKNAVIQELENSVVNLNSVNLQEVETRMKRANVIKSIPAESFTVHNQGSNSRFGEDLDRQNHAFRMQSNFTQIRSLFATPESATNQSADMKQEIDSDNEYSFKM